MNVEGAEVERMAGRSIMPRFHAAWSLGTFTGAGVGVLAAAYGVPLAVHYTVAPAVAVGIALLVSRALPTGGGPDLDAPVTSTRSAWLEPRTLAIGCMVLAFTLAEGAANDWLALSLVDGYGARHWVGVVGFALFVATHDGGAAGGAGGARPLRPGPDDAGVGGDRVPRRAGRRGGRGRRAGRRRHRAVGPGGRARVSRSG